MIEAKISKKERYKGDLHNLLRFGNSEGIIKYLVSNSNLPGPRANLELGEAFAKVIQENLDGNLNKLWNLCLKLASVPPDEAQPNDPKEFLPFCGAIGLGALGSVSGEFFEKSFSNLKRLSNDQRWRTREAVALALQRLIKNQSQKTMKELKSWVGKDNWLNMRAVVAGVAEPALVKDLNIAKPALELHKEVFDKILDAHGNNSEEFKALKKGLGYSLSVVVHELPKEGFEYMRELIKSKNKDVLWIIKENLKKDGLTKNFTKEVTSINKML